MLCILGKEKVRTPCRPAHFSESRRKTRWQSVHELSQPIFVHGHQCQTLGFRNPPIVLLYRSHKGGKGKPKRARKRINHRWADETGIECNVLVGKVSSHRCIALHSFVRWQYRSNDRTVRTIGSLGIGHRTSLLTAKPVSRRYSSQRWL